MKKYIKTINTTDALIIEFLISRFNIFDKHDLGMQVEKALKKQNFPDTIFDLSKIEYVDSIGIGFFISTKNIFNEYKKEMLLVCTPKVIEVFDTVRMDRFCKIFPSISSAAEYLKNKSSMS